MPGIGKLLIFLAIIFTSCIFEIDKTPKTISAGVVFRTIRILPDVLPESSGIEIGDSMQLFSINDSKGNATLYVVDTAGTVLRKIKISNADNEDWEDLAQDRQGNIYIGDFGNNENNRDDLMIYRLPPPSTISGNKTEAEIIEFSYEDQTKFPPQDSAAHFDCEAFFIFNDSLFLFTKDRAKQSEGKTLMYSIPAQAGTHTAMLRGEFPTFKPKPKGAVTAADISPSGLKMTLISERNVWIFTDFTGSDFFNGNIQSIELPVNYQMEGVVFINDCLLFLTSEKSGGEFSALHQLRICE